MIKPLQSITLKNDNGEDTTYVVASAPAIVETTEPASVASFSDGAEGIPVSSLIADINPVQTGSGDPSPSNVRPITGWTGMNVVRTGINIWDGEYEVGQISQSTGQNQSGTDRIRSKNYIRCLPNTEYKFSFPDAAHKTTGDIMAFFYDENKNYLGHANWSYTYTFTTVANAKYMRFFTNGSYGETYNNDISINYPATDTDYHAYNGTTYPISWADEAGTVYGGTLDVTNGVLTVTREILTINDVSWNYYTPSSGNPYFYHTESAKAPVPVGSSENPLICSILPYGGSNYASQFTDGKIWQAANLNIYIVDNSITTVSAMKTKYGTGTVVYPLATPQTYQLTPQAVLTILGQNNIWADTGDVEVSYVADTKLYIDKVIAGL